MYGFESKEFVEMLASDLRRDNPSNRYYVAAHRVSPSGVPLTWGVVRWVTYCPAMLWRHDGFVWFKGVL